MGWKHLDAKLGTEKIGESIRGVIHGMAGGDGIHQADALKFGLYGALRREGVTNHPFARLRCRDVGCEAHNHPVSLDPGNKGGCTRHKGAWGLSAPPKVMECSECGRARTDQYTWCKGCRKMFG